MTTTDPHNPMQDATPENAPEPAHETTTPPTAQEADPAAIPPPLGVRAPKPAKARGSLEGLLRAWARAQEVRLDTETLKPRLEAELATGLDGGELLNENVARGLQLKRMMLDMLPGKFAQIERREAELLAELQPEFNLRFIAYRRQFNGVRGIIHQHLSQAIRPLLADDFALDVIISQMLVPNTKLHRRCNGEVAYIEQRVSQGDWVAAARELLKREPEAAAILAEAEKLANKPAQ